MAAPVIEPVYVYTFSGQRYKELEQWWSFYEGRQHQHCRTDWGGRSRPLDERYLSYRVREKGFPPDHNKSNHDDRRPNVPMGLVTRVVDRFTEQTCGKQASIPVRGDEDSTTAMEGLLEACDGWDALTELENIGGATGSGAILPELIDGYPSHSVFKPYQLYVRSWADKAQWIPEEVIHQISVDCEVVDPKTRAVETKTMVRTRMWTATHMITFKDVDKSEWRPEDELVIADGDDAVIEHGWGRCPIVWHQNIRNTESPDGQPDVRSPANLELSDMVDRLASHAIRATNVNTAPTVVRSDRDLMFALNPTIAKGVGNEIRTSEVGKVGYLETSGDSVKMAWDGVDRLTLTFLRNTNCVIYDVDLAMAARGAGDSGEALMQRSQSMQKRCNRKRVTLKRTISQLAKLWLAKMRAVGITTEEAESEVGEPSGKLILPPRCYRKPIEIEGEENEARSRALAGSLLAGKMSPMAVLGVSDSEYVKEEYGPHVVGDGCSIDIRWPPYNDLTPMQIQAYLTALSTATGNKAVLSQQTGVELGSIALGLTDVSGEKKRLAEEKQKGLEQIQGLVEGDDPGGAAETAGAEAADTGLAGDDMEAEPGEQEPADKGPPGGTTKPP